MNEWKHPTLGTFVWEEDMWRQEGDDFYLSFETDLEEPTAPTEAHVALLQAVMADRENLITKSADALWEDINVRGPDSGMWWRGDLEGIVHQYEFVGYDAPKSAGELRAALPFRGIAIRCDISDEKRTLAELRFAPWFEEEHGIGVLTDGRSILGLGYAYDVTPFGV